MLKMEEYTVEKNWTTPIYHHPHKEEIVYVRFTWDTGYLEMRKDKWDRLSQKRKNLILAMGKSSLVSRF